MTNYQVPDLSNLANKDYKPTFYDVFKILDASIVGERTAKLGLFLTWVCARRYVMLEGGSRSGKTFIKDNVKALLGDDCYSLKSGSQKSGWYDATNIQTCQYLDIPELNQIPDEMMEVLKTWGENKTATYQVVTMEPGTNKRVNQKHILPYRPFVFCVADENKLKMNHELIYRLVRIRTDSSTDQSERITKKQASHYLLGFNKDRPEDKLIEDVRFHIRTLPPLEKYAYRNPGAYAIERTLPKLFTDSRTVHTLFQDTIIGAQRFLWKESMVVQREKGKPLLFVSPQAILQAYIIVGKIFIDSSLKCNDIQKKILTLLEHQGIESRTTIKVIKKGLKNEHKLNLSETALRKHLDELGEMGYIDITDGGMSGKMYELSDHYTPTLLNVKGNDLLDECVKQMNKNYPQYAEQYIQTYVDNPTFKHPFTGVEHDMRTYEIKPLRDEESIQPTTLKSFNPTEETVSSDNIKTHEEAVGEAPAEEETRPSEKLTDRNIIESIKLADGSMLYDDLCDAIGDDRVKRMLAEGQIHKEGAMIKVLE